MSHDGGNRKRMGRPPKYAGDRPRVSHTMRLRHSVSERLRRSAERNGRTVTEETEELVMAGIAQQDAFGGVESYEMLKEFATQLSNLEKTLGLRWFQTNLSPGKQTILEERVRDILVDTMIFERKMREPIDSKKVDDAVPSEESAEAEVARKSGGKARFATADEMEITFDPPAKRNSKRKAR